MPFKHKIVLKHNYTYMYTMYYIYSVPVPDYTPSA